MCCIKKKLNGLKKELKLKGKIVLTNPKSGTSTITQITKNSIRYTRGKSNIYLSVDLIEKTVKEFCGKKCSTADLKVFDKRYKQKPCNATFFIMLMNKLCCVSIYGKGTAKEPYYVIL